MSVALILVAFGFGFSLCLVLLGKSEKDLIDYACDLEKENSQMKIDYLKRCWDMSGNTDEK